jgi:hypothetical protein
LRVVIAWDATTNCAGAGGSCTTDVPDADLDLYVYKKNGNNWNANGKLSCSSTTFDSTWEACELSVRAGEDYLIAVNKFSANATYT